MNTANSAKQRIYLVTTAFVLVGVVLGLADAWSQRYVVGSDALNYLEISDAFLAGNWRGVISTHWSPLYPILLGSGIALARPDPQHESTIAHLITFGVYLTTIASYWFFLRELLRSVGHSGRAADPVGFEKISGLCLVGLGWTLFLWSSLQLIGVGTLTPDMCVATTVYLLAGLVLRIGRGAVSWGMFSVLGLVLAIGYLAKTVMFPIGLIFLAVAVFAAPSWRGALPKAGVSIAVLLVVGGPLVIGLSLHSGRFTIGSSGAWNYARFVNGIGRPVHWQGEPAGTGTPVHPTRQLMSRPGVYEFAYPIPGTYPAFKDPMYWYEGMRPHFDPRGTLRALRATLRFYSRLMREAWVPRLLLLALFVLIYTARRGSATFRDIWEQWPLLIPGAAALGLYAIVFTSPRYIAAFLVLLFIGCIVGLQLPSLPEMRRLAQALTLSLIVVWASSEAYGRLSAVRATFGAALGRDDGQRNLPWEIATALNDRGLAGIPTAYIGTSFHFYWARLAQDRIVAEVRDLSIEGSPYQAWINAPATSSAGFIQQNDVNLFWTGSDSTRDRVYKVLRLGGARLVVAEAPRLSPLPKGWEMLKDTGFIVYRLE